MDSISPTSSQTVSFDIEPQVSALGVRVKVLTITGLKNRDTDPAFEQIKHESLQSILQSLKQTPIDQDPILQGFRNLHTAIGFSNRNFPAASESLLEFVLKKHDLPHINLLVDIYNLISVETRLSLGAHDLDFVTGNIHLRLTNGNERFVPLGSMEPKPVRPGGYAYMDDLNDIICLLEVKQVEKTKARLETNKAFFIVQGNAQTGQGELDFAVNRLVQLINQFCGGEAHFLVPLSA